MQFSEFSELYQFITLIDSVRFIKTIINHEHIEWSAYGRYYAQSNAYQNKTPYSSGHAEDPILRPGLPARYKTWRGNVFISLGSG